MRMSMIYLKMLFWTKICLSPSLPLSISLSLSPSLPPLPPSLCQLLGSEVHEGNYCDFILFVVVPSVMPNTE